MNGKTVEASACHCREDFNEVDDSPCSSRILASSSSCMTVSNPVLASTSVFVPCSDEDFVETSGGDHIWSENVLRQSYFGGSKLSFRNASHRTDDGSQFKVVQAFDSFFESVTMSWNAAVVCPEMKVLLHQLAGDVAIAFAVTAAIAPFLTIIDKALVERSNFVAAPLHSPSFASSPTTAMVRSMTTFTGQILCHPVRYVQSPAFLWMWLTYASTYTAANTLRTLTETSTFPQKAPHKLPSSSAVTAESKTSSSVLFVGTTAVNSYVSILKDRAYAQMFGSSTTASVVPRITYALWLSRDFTVIGSSFVLPTYVGQLLDQWKNNPHATADYSSNKRTTKTSAATAQLISPVLAQIVAGPLHYAGLDCCNRSLSTRNMSLYRRFTERLQFVREGFLEVVTVRMIRVLPGYGIGGVCNTYLRNQWKQRCTQIHV